MNGNLMKPSSKKTTAKNSPKGSSPQASAGRKNTPKDRLPKRLLEEKKPSFRSIGPSKTLGLAIWRQLLSLGAALDDAAIIALAHKHKNHCMRLWEGFTGHKALPRDYLSRSEYRLAYLLSFHLINSARLEVLLRRLMSERRMNLPDLPVNLWDFGCGSGAMASTVIDYLASKRLKLAELHLGDSIASLLAQVEKSLLVALPKGLLLGKIHRHTSTFAPGDVRTAQLDPEQTHIFTFGYHLNELDEVARANMVAWMGKLARSRAPVLVLIVDSSDEQVCKGLMDFRDEVVENGMKAIYPCPHDYACPLVATNDWCYSESLWNLPAIQQKIDEIIQHPRRTMTMSSYAYANQSFLRHQRLPAKPQKVLVGKPLDKFRKDMQIPVYCQEDGEIKKELDLAVPRLQAMRGSVK